MSQYAYKAANADGKIFSGILEADTTASARAALRKKGLLAISLNLRRTTDRTGVSGVTKLCFWLSIRPVLDRKGLALMTRQMATLLSNNVQIERAIATAGRQAKSSRARELLESIRRDVVEGRSFANALRRAPGPFSDQYIASVSAGEATGRLGQIMMHLSEYVDAEQKNRQTVQLAFVYPAFLALISSTIILMLMTYVVPDIVSVYQRRGTELPLPTTLLISASLWLRHFGVLTSLIIGAGVALYLWCMRYGSLRLKRDRIMIKSLMFGRFIRRRNAAEFSGTLAMLIQSGVPMVTAMQIAAGVVRNSYMRSQLSAAAEAVREGKSLDAALGQVDTLSPMLLAMVSSGVISGELGASLARSADDQRQELDAEIKTLVALIEPIVLVLMGGIVLLIVMAIITPIVNLNSLAGL